MDLNSVCVSIYFSCDSSPTLCIAEPCHIHGGLYKEGQDQCYPVRQHKILEKHEDLLHTGR